MQTYNRFLCGFLGRTYGAQSERIQTSLYLLNQLECIEIEYEYLVLQHDYQHVLTQLDILYVLPSIECDLCPIFHLIIVPDNQTILLVSEDEDEYVRRLHHLNERNTFANDSRLFQGVWVGNIILYYFESNISGDCKPILRLVACNMIDRLVLLKAILGLDIC
jgi:hypothetical protein